MGHFSEPTLSFGYEESVDVVSVSPQTGPTRGGSSLDVHGRLFLDHSTLACVFVDLTGVFEPIIVPAIFRSETHLTCASPTIPDHAARVTYVGHPPPSTILPPHHPTFAPPSYHKASICSNNSTCYPQYPNRYAVEVTNNGVDRTSKGVQFAYHRPMEVTNFWPAVGPETGGTKVTVTGHNFMPHPTLRYVVGVRVGLEK